MNASAFRLNREFTDGVWDRMSAPPRNAMLAALMSSFPKGNLPSKIHFAEIAETAYWTSYGREEDHSVTVSLVYCEPEQGPEVFRFDGPIPLSARTLLKLAPAVESPRADICVWPDGQGRLGVWGFRASKADAVNTDLWVQLLGPGRVLFTYEGRTEGALIATRAVFVDPLSLLELLRPRLFNSISSVDLRPELGLRYPALLRLARQMRSHGRGGTVLVVPEGEAWRTSIKHPIQYAGGTSFLTPELPTPVPQQLVPLEGEQALSDYLRDVLSNSRTSGNSWLEPLYEQCDRIARLTAVDGALVMTPDRFVKCFGAKIQAVTTIPGSFPIRTAEPIEGHGWKTETLADLGGTRHQSAVQFVRDQPDSFAIVASQDGNVTFLTKDACSDEVVAVRQAELALLYGGIGGVY